MSFLTKLDYSNNRQIKQFELTNTQLSGTTTFGVPNEYIPENLSGNTINIDALQLIQTRGIIFPEIIPVFTGVTYQLLGRDNTSGKLVDVSNDGYIPYSGATNTLDLNSQNLTLSGSVRVNSSDTSTNKFVLEDNLAVGSNNNLFKIVNSGTTRTFITSRGQQLWKLNDGAVEVGAVAMGTPFNEPGIEFSNSVSAGTSIIRLTNSGGGLDFAANSGVGYPTTQMQLDTSGDLTLLDGDVTASAHVTSGGTASQFVKGDGSLDSSTYSSSTITKTLQIEVFARGSSVSIGYSVGDVIIPSCMNGMSLINVVATVENKGSSNTTNIQVERFRTGFLAQMLSTEVTIGDEYFAQDGVVELGGESLVFTGDKIRVEVTDIHSLVAPQGLVVVMEFEFIPI